MTEMTQEFEKYKNRNFTLISLVISILTTGTIVYHFIENWGWIDSLYFSVITLTTVGYGDFSPQTLIGKIFTIGYIILGLGIMVAFIDNVANHRINKEDKRRKKRINKKQNKNG